jgi:hypothetical protein
MNRIVFVTSLAIFLTTGCGKKPKETVPDSAPPPVDKTATGRSTTPPPSTTSGGLAGGRINGGGGGGGVFSALNAARRLNAQVELDQLALTIEQLRDPFGKMPTKEQILAELKRSAPTILKGIEEGAYILTGTMDGGGLWAYEVDADKQPGFAVIGGRATKSKPEDLKQYFPRN